MRLTFLAGAAALASLAACSSAVEAPYDPGVCYYVVPDEAEESGVRFNVVARDQPQMEHCAARLEEMRLRFLGMGGSNREIMGSYQGNFFLARTGDGRLAIPGAIQRDIDGRPVGVIAPPEQAAPAG
jgi:hypothetical protein